MVTQSLNAWVNGLARIPRLSAPLRRERAAVRADMKLARAGYDHPADACGVAQRWRDAGWTQESMPPEIVRIEEYAVRATNAPQPDTSAARRLLTHHGGRDGKRAAALVARGTDEPDVRVIRGCDQVLLALEPDQAPSDCS